MRTVLFVASLTWAILPLATLAAPVDETWAVSHRRFGAEEKRTDAS